MFDFSEVLPLSASINTFAKSDFAGVAGTRQTGCFPAFKVTAAGAATAGTDGGAFDSVALDASLRERLAVKLEAAAETAWADSQVMCWQGDAPKPPRLIHGHKMKSIR